MFTIPDKAQEGISISISFKRDAVPLLPTGLILGLVLSGCGSEESVPLPAAPAAPTSTTPTSANPTLEDNGRSSSASSTADASPSDEPEPSAEPNEDETTVLISCLDGDHRFEVTFPRHGDKLPFAKLWEITGESIWCEVDDPVEPESPLEREAYEVSGYTDNDIASLYRDCAEVNPEDTRLAGENSPAYRLTEDQAAEVQATLVLCPDHPLAAEYEDAAAMVTDPKRRAELPVFPGTYLVGVDIAPGTYRTSGTAWDGCYWARVNGDGSIIDNGFVTYAPDGVTVQLYEGEGFETDGCGTWRLEP